MDSQRKLEGALLAAQVEACRARAELDWAGMRVRGRRAYLPAAEAGLRAANTRVAQAEAALLGIIAEAPVELVPILMSRP